MRSHHAIAVVAVLLIGVGVRPFLFSAPAAEAGINVGKNDTMNVLQMDIDYPSINNLPVLDVKDPI
jgi:hypothetical protein